MGKEETEVHWRTGAQLRKQDKVFPFVSVPLPPHTLPHFLIGVPIKTISYIFMYNSNSSWESQLKSSISSLDSWSSSSSQQGKLRERRNSQFAKMKTITLLTYKAITDNFSFKNLRTWLGTAVWMPALPFLIPLIPGGLHASSDPGGSFHSLLSLSPGRHLSVLK